MKLEHDCVRDVLLWVEDNVPTNGGVYTNNLIKSLSDKWDEAQIVYSVLELNDAGFLDGGASASGSVIAINMINRITWKGHEYLDNIRDDTVWNNTKKTVISKVGSASLSIVSSVAAKLIQNQLGL